MRDAKYIGVGPSTMASNILLECAGATGTIKTNLKSNITDERLLIVADTLEDAVAATVSLLSEVWGYDRVTYITALEGYAVVTGVTGTQRCRIKLTA